MSGTGRDIGRVARDLAGYLCGTHFSLIGIRKGRCADPSTIASSHRAIHAGKGHPPFEVRLGAAEWRPRQREHELYQELRSQLDTEGVLELVLFGSIARGGATGYSDVDALLVIEDSLANDPVLLRELRPKVVAAQRAVLAYQPMQHHGFLVATPRLLTRAQTSLGMPATAVTETRSLFGRPVMAVFSDSDVNPGVSFRALAQPLLRVKSWPRHPWMLHRLVSMFELLPTLYLDATGRPTPKHASFTIARRDFRDRFHAYDILEQVRAEWPQARRPDLELLILLLRNPWVAVACWRRVPIRTPRHVTTRLTARCLDDLVDLTREMVRRVQ